MTLVFATGFAHQVAAAGAAATGGSAIWGSASGAVSIDTTTKRTTAAASLKINPAGSASSISCPPFAASIFTGVGVCYVNFSVLPTGEACNIVNILIDPYVAGVGVETNGKWFARISGGTFVTDTVGPSLGTWYRIEWSLNTAGNPWTLDWKIDGVTKAHAEAVTDSQQLTELFLGTLLSGVTATFYISDVAYSITAADYPIGGIHIKSYMPTADGTHSMGGGTFLDAAQNAIVQGSNPAYDQMDVVPISSLTEWVEQTAIATDGYVEVAFADTTETGPPLHVQVSVAMSADTATGNNATYRVRDGSTDLDIFSGDPSQTTDIYRTSGMATKPSGGAWTNDTFNALLFRFGFSNDAGPDPRCGGVIAEVVFAGDTGPVTQYGSATITGAGALTSLAFATKFGIAPLSGIGALTSAGFGTAFGVAPLSGTGALSAIGVRQVSGAATLEGTGALVGAGFSTAFGVSVLSGAGILSSSGFAISYGSSLLTGMGALSSSGWKTSYSSVTLTGTGALVSSGAVMVYGTCALSGVGALASSGFGKSFGVAVISGTSDIIAIGLRIVHGLASISGLGTLSSTSLVTSYGSAFLSGTGDLTSTGIRVFNGIATLTGAGAILASGAKVTYGVASIAGTSDAIALGVRGVVGSVILAANGEATAVALATKYAASALTGTGALTAFGNVIPVTGPTFWHRAVEYFWDTWPIRVFPGDEVWTEWNP